LGKNGINKPTLFAGNETFYYPEEIRVKYGSLIGHYRASFTTERLLFPFQK